MKKLSLPEFKRYCDTFCYRAIIVATDNQNLNSVDSTIAIELEFSDMLITLNPNVIHLRDGKNSMRLKRVKSIKLHDDFCLLGRVFTVVCGDQTKSNDKEYTLIAQ